MMEISTLSILTFGFLLGLKHAIEADHVAAVSTIASESSSLFGSSVVGALWGVGHTISLLIAAVALVVLGLQVGPRLSAFLEFIVGLMLIVLGTNALLKLLRGGHLHMHVHQHGGRVHSHPHIHGAKNQVESSRSHHGLKLQRRPIIIGMVHGLAGSGALMLLVLSTIRRPVAAFVYVLVFGIGSTGGMMLMSLLIGLPAKLTARRFTWANTAIRGVAAVFSIALGLFISYEIGFRGLFAWM